MVPQAMGFALNCGFVSRGQDGVAAFRRGGCQRIEIRLRKEGGVEVDRRHATTGSRAAGLGDGADHLVA